MIRTTLIGAVPLGAIVVIAIIKPVVLLILAGACFAAFICLGLGFMIEDLLDL